MLTVLRPALASECQVGPALGAGRFQVGDGGLFLGLGSQQLGPRLFGLC